ncbi:DUF5123 domain-containing protein [Dyadobacter luteus]|jgi:hypothetical protein|uniref:DUF5123 domain-containing protein n=1 Tax=Dyadobacter luteus TaxID=2259619 RepID=A0A3D8YCK5_9BACT|nr:DUF5123 domain-containing protein [Dyadobacter luteus]REA61546.1 DUF5123 domain-containing protein [Dyadobacter luteus]
MKNIQLMKNMLLGLGLMFSIVACKEELPDPVTRLFMPVLNKDLTAERNTIIVNMGNIKAANSYTIEVSRDTFRTVDYTLKVDTNYVVLDEATLNGDPLFWNMLYQVRAKAHAADSQYDSKVSNLGSVSTERFPSIQVTPTRNDVIDKALKVKWQPGGSTPVSKIKLFAGTDLKLLKPLKEVAVTAAQQQAGTAIVDGLTPLTSYQAAIYSGEELRGWQVYTTLKAGIDLTAPGVINLTKSEDPTALATALAAAPSGSVIVLKKGVSYNTPTVALDKSITIASAQGFEEKPATLINCNWNIANGVTLDLVKFQGVQIIGSGIASAYVFNPSPSALTTVKELVFDDCTISELRGILRIRTQAFINKYTISNSLVYNIGGYGLLTTDTDGEGMAAVDEILFENSTFSKVNAFLTSRQNSKKVTIESCTFSEFLISGGTLFNWRGTAGQRSNVKEGISVKNSVFGHAWDEASTQSYAIRGLAGLEATTLSFINSFATSDFAFVAGGELPGFPVGTYAKKATDLWVSPYTGLNFNFKDVAFSGRRTVGDPRWRVK